MSQQQISEQQSKILLRRVRRRARRTGQMLRIRQISLAGAPILFANSFPKSGTHLLTQVLVGFTRIGPAVDSGFPAIVTYQGNTGRARPEQEILDDFNRLLPGDITYGHVHAFPQVVEYVSRGKFAPYFILRDPRDVVVSHVHYVTEMESRHIHHAYYNKELHNFDERLATSITGIPVGDPANRSGHPLSDIYHRFKPYLGWLDKPEVLVLRFEEFIANGEKTLGRVYDHAITRGFKANCERETGIRILGEGINPQASPTFRSGKAGGWQAAFTDEHKRLFKEVSGDLLIRLGYVENADW